MILISKCRTEEDTREYCLAPDLSVWIPPKTLATIVLDAVQTVAESILQPVFSTDQARMMSPRVFLGLLVYCYSVGVFRSENIVKRMTMDETLRFLSGGCVPEGADIRRFRHLNRAQIEKCLERVCLAVWRIKHGNSHARIDPHRQSQIICEVKERLDKAKRLDYGLVEGNPFVAYSA